MPFFRDASGSGIVDAVVAKHKASFGTKPGIANVAVVKPQVLSPGCSVAQPLASSAQKLSVAVALHLVSTPNYDI